MKRLVYSCIVGLALLLVPQQGHAVAFNVQTATVPPGNQFFTFIDVVGATSLTSWQFDLGYNPAILQAREVLEGRFLNSTGGPTVFTPGVIDNTSGKISLVANSFVGLTPPSGSGSLARITFFPLGTGSSPLTASNVFLNFLDSGFNVNNGSVTIGGPAAAPEPSTVALLSLGLGIWYFIQRRQGVRR